MAANQRFINIPNFHVKRRPITMFAVPCIWTTHSSIFYHLTSLHITSSIHPSSLRITSSIHLTSLHITSSIHFTSQHITALIFEFSKISIQAPKRFSHFSFHQHNLMYINNHRKYCSVFLLSFLIYSSQSIKTIIAKTSNYIFHSLITTSLSVPKLSQHSFHQHS